MTKQEIQEALTKKQTFKSKNVEAFYIGTDYHVKSYETIIYTDSKGLDTKVYSKTTSILQGFLYTLLYCADIRSIKRIKAVFTKV